MWKEVWKKLTKKLLQNHLCGEQNYQHSKHCRLSLSTKLLSRPNGRVDSPFAFFQTAFMQILFSFITCCPVPQPALEPDLVAPHFYSEHCLPTPTPSLL